MTFPPSTCLTEREMERQPFHHLNPLYFRPSCPSRSFDRESCQALRSWDQLREIAVPKSACQKQNVCSAAFARLCTECMTGMSSISFSLFFADRNILYISIFDHLFRYSSSPDLRHAYLGTDWDMMMMKQERAEQAADLTVMTACKQTSLLLPDFFCRQGIRWPESAAASVCFASHDS